MPLACPLVAFICPAEALLPIIIDQVQAAVEVDVGDENCSLIMVP